MTVQGTAGERAMGEEGGVLVSMRADVVCIHSMCGTVGQHPTSSSRATPEQILCTRTSPRVTLQKYDTPTWLLPGMLVWQAPGVIAFGLLYGIGRVIIV